MNRPLVLRVGDVEVSTVCNEMTHNREETVIFHDDGRQSIIYNERIDAIWDSQNNCIKWAD